VHKRLGAKFTNFRKTASKIPEIVVDRRRIFDWWPAKSVATVLVRAPDGLTIDEHTFLTFLEMARDRETTLQLMFQYIEVFDEIRPLDRRPFKGLGSVLVLSGDECLDHLEKVEGKHSADVARLMDIWVWLRDMKNKNQGMQDRNDLPDEDMKAAKVAKPGENRKCIGPTSKEKKQAPAKGKGKGKAPVKGKGKAKA
jgi:hypothetical protein